jgi:hypothetical protein
MAFFRSRSKALVLLIAMKFERMTELKSLIHCARLIIMRHLRALIEYVALLESFIGAAAIFAVHI